MVLSEKTTAQIRRVLEEHPEGISITGLVKFVAINRNTAGRYLENLLLSGQVEMRRFGMAKLYTLTKRLPISSVLSLSSEMVMHLDAGQRIAIANDPLLSFLGVPAQDLIGKNIEFTQFPVVFEDVFGELLDRIRKGLKGEEWHGELAAPVQDRTLFCRITPTVTGEGKKGVSVILEDISDRKRDEERIEKSEARLRSIFKVSPVGIGVVADRILLEVNDRFCEMTGYSHAELIGRPMRILYPSEEAFNTVGALYNRQIRQSGTSSLETRWIKKNGTVIDVLLNSTPLDPADISRGITFTALDITTRNRALQALRESGERLQLALTGSETGMWWIDIPSMRGSIDERAAAILGYPKTAVRAYQADWDALSHPDDVPHIHRRLADYLDGRAPLFESEHRMRHASGRWIWVVGRGKITHQSSDGSCKRISGTINDITGRKLAEQALRESEERYRTLSETSQDIIFLIGRDDRVEYVNSYAAATLGLPAGQIIGKKRSSFFSGELGDHQAAGLRRIFGTGKGGRSEGVMEISGSLHWFDHYLMPIRDANGTVSSVLGVSRDITERKHAEAAVRESDGRFRTLFEGALNPVMMVNAEGRYIEANEAALRFLETEKEELLKRTVWDYAPKELLETQIRDHSPFTMPRTIETVYSVRGREKVLILNVIPTRIAGEPVLIGIGQDITGRKQAEEALRESEETARALLNAPTDTIILLDNQGVILDLNETAVRRLGRRREDLVGRLSYTVLPPALALERREKISEVLKTGKPVRFSDENRGAWFDNVVYPVLDKRGNVARLAIIARDITDQKRTEASLRESEEKYRSLVEQSLQGLTIIQNGRPVYANSTMLEIGGYSFDEYLALSPEELMATVHPEDRDRIRNAMTARLAGKIFPAENEFRILRKDGQIRWVHTRGMLITYNGAPAIQLAYFDITTRKLAEDALRESEDRYRKLVEISPNAVLLHRDRRIIYANQALASILGTEKADDLLGKDVMDIIHPAYREAVKANIAKDLTGKSTPFMELQMIRADGTLVTMEGQGVGTSIDGKPAVLVAIRDVNRRPEPRPATQTGEDA